MGCRMRFRRIFEKKPILQGKTDIDQGHVIFKLLGTPTEEDWAVARYLPGAELTTTNFKPTLRERFGKYLSETGLDF
nr:BPK_HP1_G0058210.mRNA.1.CDS.1 [Saccharomyces cerevisiae]